MKTILIIALVLLIILGMVTLKFYLNKTSDNKTLTPLTKESREKQIKILETGIKDACESGLCNTKQVLEAKQKIEELK